MLGAVVIMTLEHPNGHGSIGIVATCDIAAGEPVIIMEERPGQLVSLQHVGKNWPEWRKKVFKQSGTRSSDGIF